jgi:hypothetical protein
VSLPIQKLVATAEDGGMYIRPGLLARRELPAVAIASVLLMLGAAGCGQANGSSSEPLTRKPSSANMALAQSPAAARSIVNSLWSQRESALASLDTSEINRLESAFAKQQDDAYINAVRCRCEPQKNPHPSDLVVPQIPKASGQSVLFAQVRTTNLDTGERPWYVVAVERDGTGSWKLAHINFGGYKAAPPLRGLTNSDGYTLRVSAASRARMTHLAETYIRYAMTHNKLTHRTDYGATVHSRYAMKPERDGIYGLALPSGQLLSCFAMHRIDTYSLQSGLPQGPARTQWGHLLPRGIYKSITVDDAAPMCVVGRGVGKTVGVLRLKYDKRVIATTGVRK